MPEILYSQEARPCSSFRFPCSLWLKTKEQAGQESRRSDEGGGQERGKSRRGGRHMEWGASMLRALTVLEPAAGTISANDLAGAWSRLRTCRRSGSPADPVPAINIFWSLLIASHALSSCQTTSSQAAVALLPGPPSSGQSDLSVAYKHCSSALQEPFGHVMLIWKHVHLHPQCHEPCQILSS